MHATSSLQLLFGHVRAAVQGRLRRRPRHLHLLLLDALHRSEGGVLWKGSSGSSGPWHWGVLWKGCSGSSGSSGPWQWGVLVKGCSGSSGPWQGGVLGKGCGGCSGCSGSRGHWQWGVLGCGCRGSSGPWQGGVLGRGCSGSSGPRRRPCSHLGRGKSCSGSSSPRQLRCHLVGPLGTAGRWCHSGLRSAGGVGPRLGCRLRSATAAAGGCWCGQQE